MIPKSRENSGKSISTTNHRQSKQLSGIAMSAQAGFNRGGKHNGEGMEGLHSSQDPPEMLNTMTHSATFNNYKRHV